MIPPLGPNQRGKDEKTQNSQEQYQKTGRLVAITRLRASGFEGRTKEYTQKGTAEDSTKRNGLSRSQVDRVGEMQREKDYGPQSSASKCAENQHSSLVRGSRFRLAG